MILVTMVIITAAIDDCHQLLAWFVDLVCVNFIVCMTRICVHNTICTNFSDHLLPPVENFRVKMVGPNSITVEWNVSCSV